MLNKVKPSFDDKLKLLRISCYLLVSLEVYLCIIPIACLHFDSLFQDDIDHRGESQKYRYAKEILHLCGSAEIQGYS